MDSLTFASTPAKVSVATYLLTSYLTAMSAKVKFLYFPLHARAEVIRLTLKAGGMEYEEEIVTFDKWPAVKPRKLPECVPWPTHTRCVCQARDHAFRTSLGSPPKAILFPITPQSNTSCHS